MLARVADQFLFYVVQAPLLLALVAASVARTWIERGYYGVSRLRRRVKGEPLWQEHDRLIGKEPPPPP